MGDVGFEEGGAFGLEAMFFVEGVEAGLGVKFEFSESAFVCGGEHEFDEAIAVTLVAPSLADGEAFEFGDVSQKSDAGGGDGFALDIADDLKGFVVVGVHFLGIGDILFFHENDGANKKGFGEIVRLAGDVEERGCFLDGTHEK